MNYKFFTYFFIIISAIMMSFILNNNTVNNIDDKSIDNNVTNQVKNQLKSTNQIKTSLEKNLSKDNQSSKIEITSFKDLIERANKEKEIELVIYYVICLVATRYLKIILLQWFVKEKKWV